MKMNRLAFVAAGAAALTALSGCVAVPAGPGNYEGGPGYYAPAPVYYAPAVYFGTSIGIYGGGRGRGHSRR